MSLEPTVLEGEAEVIIGAERGDVRAALVVPDDQDLDVDDVDRALDRLRAVATYELEGRRLVADGGVDQEERQAHCGRCGDFLPDGFEDGELCLECEAETEEPTILEVYPSDILLLLKLSTIGFVVAEALDDSEKYEAVPLDRPLDDVRLLLVDYARELDAGQHWNEDDLDPLAEALEAEGLL